MDTIGDMGRKSDILFEDGGIQTGIENDGNAACADRLANRRTVALEITVTAVNCFDCVAACG